MKKASGEPIIFILILLLVTGHSSPVEVKPLTKIKEIGPAVSEERDINFWHIDDIGCDKEGNLYVADSGWNKIFKLDSAGQFVLSFGQEGQGPGEFLSQPYRYRLRLTIGNDGLIYVVDRGNRRLSVFNQNSILMKTFPLPEKLADKPVVNSKGYIYFINTDDKLKKAILCFDSHFKLTDSFLPLKWHFVFPVYKPDKKIAETFFSGSLIPLITASDHLVALSNYALNVFLFNNLHQMIKKFPLNNDAFLADFKGRLKASIAQGGIIVPFSAFLGPEDILYLLYANKSKKQYEIYRYDLEGRLLDILTIDEPRTRGIGCVPDNKYLYLVLNDEKIAVYKLNN